MISIVWIGATSILVDPIGGVRSRRDRWSVMNTYAGPIRTRAVTENVFNGLLEWHFNESEKQLATVSLSET